jgi:hypothetical protein
VQAHLVPARPAIVSSKAVILKHFCQIGDSVSNFYFDPPFTFPLGITGKPFQARYERIASGKSSDTEAVREERYGAVHRASDGRSRTVKYESGKDRMTEIEAIIYDPLQGKAYFLDPESQTFYRTALPKAASGAEEASFAETLRAAASGSDDLGQKVIENFVCQGYGVTTPDGSTVEYWLSEELSALLAARSVRDNEEITFQLYDIQRVEPENHLLTVPADYEDAS